MKAFRLSEDRRVLISHRESMVSIGILHVVMSMYVGFVLWMREISVE